jgi:hypothetical protein
MNIKYDAYLFMPYRVSEYAFLFWMFMFHSLGYLSEHVFEYHASWKPETFHKSVTDITDSTFHLYFMQQTGEYNYSIFFCLAVINIYKHLMINIWNSSFLVWSRAEWWKQVYLCLWLVSLAYHVWAMTAHPVKWWTGRPWFNFQHRQDLSFICHVQNDSLVPLNFLARGHHGLYMCW